MARRVRPYRPTDDDRRRAACACFLFAAVCALDLWLRPTGVTRAEFGGGVGGVIVGVLSGLAGLFGGGGKVDGTTLRILTGLRDAVVAVGTSFTGYAYETNGKLGRIAGILSRLWDAVLLPFIKKTDGKIRGVYDWLKATLGPVIEALKWLRKHVLDIYDKYFRPILDTIDAIRGVLRVLSLLHVKIAAKLDAQLAALEHRLLAPIRLALETINALIDWTQRVITADGFFQRYTFLVSQIRYAAQSWNVLLHPQLAGVDKFDAAGARARVVEPIDPAQLRNAVTQYYATGTGPLADQIAAARARTGLVDTVS